MQEPLLCDTDDLSRRTSRCLLEGCQSPTRLAARAARCLRYWWRITTDADFLESGVSRRRLLKITVPLISIVYLAYDVVAAAVGTGPWLNVLIDLPVTLAACAYSMASVRSSNLTTDFLFGMMVTVGVALCISSAPLDNSQFESLLGWFPTTLVCFAFQGFHSLVVAWLWVVSLATWYSCLLSSLPAASSPSVQSALFQSTMIAVSYIAFEFALASLHHKWQGQLRCNETLLETVTDGFGAVDSSTGVVLSASSKLLQSLGSSSLVVGQVLGSAGALNSIDSAALTKFFGDTERALPPEAILVTWTSLGFEFEVRMVPFHLEGSVVGFCVQQVGEKRSCHIRADGGAVTAQQPQHRQQEATDPGWDQFPAAASDQGAAHMEDSGIRPPPEIQQHLGRQLHRKRRLGTLSLSSWSVSCDGAGAATTAAASKKKVETRTLGVQAEPQRLPAPLSASSVPREGQVKAMKKQRLKRVYKASVREGKPHLVQFTATPRFSRFNALRELVASFNVDGKGCCSHHIAWMGVQEFVTEELMRPCGPILLFKDWQCPECSALNNLDIFPPVDEDDVEQLCILCHDFVEPRLPLTPQPQQLPLAANAADTPSDTGGGGSDDSNSALSGDDSDSDVVHAASLS